MILKYVTGYKLISWYKIDSQGKKKRKEIIYLSSEMTEITFNIWNERDLRNNALLVICEIVDIKKEDSTLWIRKSGCLCIILLVLIT